MFKGFEDLNWHHNSINLLKTRERAQTRGHNLRVKKEVFSARLINDNSTSVGVRQNFLNNKVVEDWNNLPSEAVNSNTVNSFKSKLDKWLENS